ncbi:L-type lectin-domain containing receptor kinase IV.1 [Acorus calamus]|uniref:non-specific serine/threonine protein kinase n=1 Tax=Acorus calamus TaxID=4465 RepID=A0AAV9DEZ0_ACOCL|nr:L-type lectin-domain containing receptor kinase IV.1 [Acorus calamus]
MSLNGQAEITSNGLLRLTNNTKQQMGHAFYPTPLHFNKSFSFSTTFVFAIVPEDPQVSGNGIAFVLSPNTNLPGSIPNQYFGLFNSANNGNSSNHVIAVELDTILNFEFGDIDDNHVGIDVNGLKSVKANTAGFFSDGSNHVFHNLSLTSGQPMQLWVDYNGPDTELNVTLSPIKASKPVVPLMSITIDLSNSTLDSMYAGFSSSTGSVLTTHYILGWSFCFNGRAQDLDLSNLPSLPRIGPKEKPKVLTVGLPVILSLVALIVASIVGVMLWRSRKFAEVMEDWELEYGPHRFSYKELYTATRGFREQELLGAGGFGRVYKGVLPTNNCEVAIKRVSHESRQGMREFVAEIVSIGRLRHRNIVQLLGYCRRKGELLLVYDYMSNGSLDNLLFDGTKKGDLGWSQRFRIVRGVASGLLYLHEGWEQLVIHRDVKSSNMLLDGDLNGRLGDFGLARLYDHGTDPLTTHVVGTLGYLAPELSMTGKGTTATDVFSFGAFLLEVACGRRPIDLRAEEPIILVDWVLDHWQRGTLMETVDERLGSEYSVEEVELVLKLGLLCTHAIPPARPSMWQVMQFLDRDVELPDLSPDYMNVCVPHMEGYQVLMISSCLMGLLQTTRSCTLRLLRCPYSLVDIDQMICLGLRIECSFQGLDPLFVFCVLRFHHGKCVIYISFGEYRIEIIVNYHRSFTVLF